MIDGSYIQFKIEEIHSEELKNRLSSLNFEFCLLIYDITNSKTFDACKNIFENNFYFEQYSQKVILLGNKNDLNNKREISKEIGFNFAKENECTFMENSCVDFANTSKIFDRSGKWPSRF